MQVRPSKSPRYSIDIYFNLHVSILYITAYHRAWHLDLSMFCNWTNINVTCATCTHAKLKHTTTDSSYSGSGGVYPDRGGVAVGARHSNGNRSGFSSRAFAYSGKETLFSSFKACCLFRIIPWRKTCSCL